VTGSLQSLAAEPVVRSRLEETRAAFDSVAADYDDDRGNNAAIQDMREETWRWLDRSFPAHSRLLDIGCGTGLDAARMARLGHRVTAVDWSPEMVRRTRDRAQAEGLSQSVESLNLGGQELDRLAEGGCYDGAYSNLGALNCLPDLDGVGRECARLLRPGAHLVFAVIGRVCPWELGYYLLKRRWGRATVRYARGVVPVGLNRHTVWTRYYTPREFYRPFEREFELTGYRGVCIFVPPPYLLWLRRRHPRWHQRLWRLDRRVAGWPLLRAIGDHFLIVMRRRA
jgi:SAM-dependent methyltransferase